MIGGLTISTAVGVVGGSLDVGHVEDVYFSVN